MSYDDKSDYYNGKMSPCLIAKHLSKLDGNKGGVEAVLDSMF